MRAGIALAFVALAYSMASYSTRNCATSRVQAEGSETKDRCGTDSQRDVCRAVGGF